MTIEELINQLYNADMTLAAQVFMACDADPDLVHATTGVRLVGDKIVIDISTLCEDE